MQGRSDDQRELLDAESVVGHLLKAESVFAFLAAHRSELFPEEMFADLFPSRRGRPSVPAEVMASVITLQALHGLSDNDTVDAVTFDLRWKAACGLPITAGAFHSTTLTYWRRRLAASERPNRIFEAVKAVVAATGALAGKTRRALDSTILDDAVATQDTVTQLIGAVRRVAREVPGASEIAAANCTAHDYDDPGKPAIAWDDAEARAALVDALVSDAHRLLGHLPEQELGARAAEAVALLALIAGQDVEPDTDSDGTDGRWRIAARVAPDRVISTSDPEARHAHKTVHRRQDGFKAHIAVEPDTGIITDCMLTKASGPDTHDAAVAEYLLAEETEPVTVLGDSAYGSGDFRAYLAEAKHVDRVKSAPLRPAVVGGFSTDDFVIDHGARTITCPAAVTRQISAKGNATFGVACRGCTLRAQCTTSRDGRSVKLQPHDTLQRKARRESQKPRWLHEYRQHRPMVERTIAWLTRGNRKVRYRGVSRNDHWLHHRAAAVNLRRLITLGLTHNGTHWAIA
ncbi:IS1182 family transposase [Mycolicibacterium palauense]|uniref:IS1182 family transposase n=1 Tax=Mycolicibacterium palauense TaxID=2034511 RepID=UPI000BFEB5BC|nr:IS1182 family transposase [Mycolicibacterium palauense]